MHGERKLKKKKEKEGSTIQILTGASKIVNLVVWVWKCALPTSMVLPCDQNHLSILIISYKVES